MAALWCPLAAAVVLARGPLQGPSLGARHVGLLAQSVGYAAAVGTLCTAVGLLAALRLWKVGATRRPWVQGMLAALVALPPTVLATGWMGLSGGFGRYWTQGWLPSTLIQSLALAPLATCVVALSLERLDGDVLDAARVAKGPGPQFAKVLLPLLWPALAASLSLTALVSLGDFTIPSLFAATPYSLEILAMFSAGEDAVAACWPLAALALPLAWVAGRWTSTLVAVRGPRRASRIAFPGAVSRLARGTTLVVGLAFLSALLLLILQSRSPQEAVGAIAGSGEETRATLWFAGVGALLAIAIGAAAAPALVVSTGPLAWTLVLAPVALPPALVGIGIARLGAWAHGSAGADALVALGPALASAVRFAPFAAALLAVEWARLDPACVDAGRVFAPPVRRALRLGWPLMSAGALAGFSLAFALGVGELGATLLVVPPGSSTLSLRLFNLLHYGASEDVAALALLLAALALGVAMVSGWALARISRWEGSNADAG